MCDFRKALIEEDEGGMKMNKIETITFNGKTYLLTEELTENQKENLNKNILLYKEAIERNNKAIERNKKESMELREYYDRLGGKGVEILDCTMMENAIKELEAQNTISEEAIQACLKMLRLNKAYKD